MTSAPINPAAVANAFNALADQLRNALNPTAALTALMLDDADHTRAQRLLADLTDDRLATVERAATQLAYRAADIRADRARVEAQKTS